MVWWNDILKLNDSEIEVILFGLKHHRKNNGEIGTVEDYSISVVSSFRNIGDFYDWIISMDDLLQKAIAIHSQLWQVQMMRKYFQSLQILSPSPSHITARLPL